MEIIAENVHGEARVYFQIVNVKKVDFSMDSTVNFVHGAQKDPMGTALVMVTEYMIKRAIHATNVRSAGKSLSLFPIVSVNLMCGFLILFAIPSHVVQERIHRVFAKSRYNLTKIGIYAFNVP